MRREPHSATGKKDTEVSPLMLATALGSLVIVAGSSPYAPHPYDRMPTGPLTIDASPEARASGSWVQRPEWSGPRLVQRGGAWLPEPVADGAAIDPDPRPGWLDVPGNEYPRKHTVYLNFQGGDMQGGADNSAENRSSLARYGPYPAFTGGEQKALAAIEAFKIDVAEYGIRVMAQERPRKTVPYTMVMIGGDVSDTLHPDPASGVAPSSDCEAHGQRHVAYTFADAGWSAIEIANVTSQEAGHSWGLDHTTNCASVMAYCGGGDKSFSDACDPLCESACQGANTISCRAVHEKHCGDGSNRQNEHAELSFIFGTNEPDVTPPVARILAPADGDMFEPGSTVKMRADVGDDHGGVGWKLYFEHDGEVLLDEVDYDKAALDGNYDVALDGTNLPPGTYVFRIEAEDHADHVVTDEITFFVEDPAGGTGPDGSTDGATTSGTSGGSSGDLPPGGSTGVPGPSSGGLTDGGSGMAGADPNGCSCGRSDPVRGSVFLALAFLFLGRRAKTRVARNG